MNKTRLMGELLPVVQIALPEIKNATCGEDRSDSSPLAGEVRWGGPPHSSSPDFLPHLSPKPHAPSPNPSREGRGILPDSLDPISLFSPKPKDIWLEIGFGGGEHLAAQAKLHPGIGFIGAEPFVNGVANLLVHIDNDKLTNVRILPDDARGLLDALPDASIARCYVLFADPWPKARHAERRFIGPENLPRIARVLRPGGELHLATDDRKLAAWMQEHVEASPAFMPYIKPSTQPPAGWVSTRYEQKAIIAGRKPVYSIYTRIPSPAQREREGPTA